MNMTAKGSFEIDLEPQSDSAAPMGRMLISKTYVGNIEARGSGQMFRWEGKRVVLASHTPLVPK